MEYHDMPTQHRYIPVPYLKVNQEGNIVGCSDEARQLFPLNLGALEDLIDEGSIKKLENGLNSLDGKNVLELNIHTVKSPLALFDVHITSDSEGFYHFVFMSKEKNTVLVAKKLEALKARLATTNFELFQNKEDLEKANRYLNQQSAPFITLMDKIGYIPLFGDLTSEKVKIFTQTISAAVNDGDFDYILFDFTPAGKIMDDGFKALNELFTIIKIVSGGYLYVIGVNPQQAPILMQNTLSMDIHYELSLEKFLKKHKKN
ncbi:hypothetical protein ACFVHQ_08795 [Actinomycetes bacterium NPDC127524]